MTMPLRQVDAGAAVVACSTCRHSVDARDDAEGRRGGALLAEALRRVKASDPAYDGVAVQDMPCLFACKDFCTVHLRAPDKVGYVMGRFEPTEDAARAILDYARAYADSEWGQVPFREWPAGVKGHFITRTPPAGYVVE
jgi:predicted metal-binding protein